MPSPSWLPSWPASWPDIEAIYDRTIRGQFPAGLYDNEESDEYKDIGAIAEFFANITKSLWWLKKTFLPQNDEDDLYLEKWEADFNISKDSTIAKRQYNLVSHCRTLQTTGTSDIIKAIVLPVFGSEDPDDLSFASPDAVDVYRALPWKWNEFTGTAPDACRAHNMARMDHQNKIIFFGGFKAAPSNDFFEFDESTETWTELFPADLPSGRYGHAMCYNSNDQKIYLFGGNDAGGLVDDLWCWDGTNWVEITPATTSPDARMYATMCYLPAVDALVMFGGYVAAANNETWHYDFSAGDWVEQNPATDPGIRYGHGMVYHKADELIYMGFGFQGAIGGEDCYENMYSYDGTNWTLLAPTVTPGPRRNVSMVYDDHGQRIFLIGGQHYDTLTYYNDVWSYYDGQWWENYDESESSDKIVPYMQKNAVYCTSIKKILFHGGDKGGPSNIDGTYLYSLVEDVETWGLYNNSLHIYHTAETQDENYTLAQKVLKLIQSAAECWSIGRYALAEYGDETTDEEFGTYDTCLYDG